MFGRSSSTTSKSKKKEEEISATVLESLFSQYADEDDPDIISMDGIGKISEKLSLDPSADVRILVILFKLGAFSKPGVITKTEFVAGMRRLKKDSIEGLLDVMPSFDPGFMDKYEFRGISYIIKFVYIHGIKSIISCLFVMLEFYKFVFQFSREGTHKTIGILPYIFLILYHSEYLTIHTYI